MKSVRTARLRNPTFTERGSNVMKIHKYLIQQVVSMTHLGHTGLVYILGLWVVIHLVALLVLYIVTLHNVLQSTDKDAAKTEKKGIVRYLSLNVIK